MWEDLNWSQWLSEFDLIQILDSFPVLDASKPKKNPVKNLAISFIWYYLLASSSNSPALLLSYMSKTSATKH